MHSLAHEAVDADRRVAQGPGNYYGGVLLASSAGYATVNVYDGDNTNGELIASFVAGASLVDRDVRHVGVHYERGLFVDIGSNVSKFTIYYDVFKGD